MELDVKQLVLALKTIAEEKNLPEDTVKEVVEQALAAAYRRDYGDREQEVRVSMNLNTGEVDAYVTKEVVEEVKDPAYEIGVAEAQVRKKDRRKDQYTGNAENEEIEIFRRAADNDADRYLAGGHRRMAGGNLASLRCFAKGIRFGMFLDDGRHRAYSIQDRKRQTYSAPFCVKATTAPV